MAFVVYIIIGILLATLYQKLGWLDKFFIETESVEFFLSVVAWPFLIVGLLIYPFIVLSGKYLEWLKS